jgi:hypothetical protein
MQRGAMRRRNAERVGSFRPRNPIMQRLLLVAALTAPLGLAPAIRAQVNTPDLVPRDVVLAILRSAGNQVQGDPSILLGDHLPDNLVNKVSLPPGARVMATLEAWSSTDVIGTASLAPDSLRSWFTAEFVRRGYEAQDMSGRREPFRPAQGSMFGGFCGAGTFFSVTAQARQGGRTEFVLRTRQRPTCDQTPVFGFNTTGSSWSSGGFNPPPLPMLVNPKSSEIAQRCDPRGNGGSNTTTQVGLSTTATPDQLLAHYSKQLDSAGWKREAVASGIVATWVRRDSTGRDVRAQLTVMMTPSTPDCRWLTMTSTNAP